MSRGEEQHTDLRSASILPPQVASKPIVGGLRCHRTLTRNFTKSFCVKAALLQRGPRLFKQSVPQSIEFILLRAHPVRVLEHQVLKAAHPAEE